MEKQKMKTQAIQRIVRPPHYFTQFYCINCKEYVSQQLTEFTWKTAKCKIQKSTMSKPYCPTCHRRLRTRPRRRDSKDKYYR